MLAPIGSSLQSGARRELPAFLKQRMDEFYLDRWKGEWKGKHIMRGRTPGRGDVQLMSNDYLAIATHPEISQAQADALLSNRDSVLMSGVFLEEDCAQHDFEHRMAQWTGFAEAIISQSGYAANVGLIQAVVEPGVPVYLDMRAHASLWEGVQSAGATAHGFRHNDAEHLARQIRRYGPGLVCVDSVYSTMGSVCPLERMVTTAKGLDCLVLVDESHSLGTHGPAGAGLVCGLGLSSQVDFVTASLAKAFAARAGIILCHKGFREYFWFTARPAIFSSCLLPHEVAGLDATLTVVQRDQWRRHQLHANARYLREGLDALGYNVADSQSQIIALEAGRERDTLALREALEAEGVFGSVFCAPATARKRALVRLSVNAGMTRAELDHVLRACAAVREKVGMWQWPSTLRKQERQALAS